jgi:hypothetical protein
MSTVLSSTVAAILIISLGGCTGGASPDATVGEAALILHPPPAYPDVSWQFTGCLDDDHRLGLDEAMLQLAAGWSGSPLTGNLLDHAIADSRCINGNERGGLFRNDRGDRGAGLAKLAILPGSSQYAFSVGGSLVADLMQRMYLQLPQRFDADGTPDANGRFALAGWDFSPTVSTGFVLHVADTAPYGKTSDILTRSMHNTIHTSANGTGPAVAAIDGLWPDEKYMQCDLDPPVGDIAISDDPLLETVILARDAFLKKTYPNARYELYYPGAACLAIALLSTGAIASMQGWPLPYDTTPVIADGNGQLTFGDGNGGLIFSGGTVIP